MNLIRLGPDITFDRPLQRVGIGGDSIVSVPPLAEVIPEGPSAAGLGTRTLSAISEAAHWRQVAFHNEQVEQMREQARRLEEKPEKADHRTTLLEMSDLHAMALTQHLTTLGVIEPPAPLDAAAN